MLKKESCECYEISRRLTFKSWQLVFLRLYARGIVELSVGRYHKRERRDRAQCEDRVVV